MITGLDVSHHQGDIDWSRVAADGYAFAFCKATDGLTAVDPRFRENFDGAVGAGLLVGAYHYGHPDRDPIDQAHHHANTIGQLRTLQLPCVLDLEETEGQSTAKLRSWASDFLQALDHLTQRNTLLYTGWAFWNDHLSGVVPTSRVWIARYGPNPGTQFPFWQHTSEGHVPGIYGHVDLNEYRGTSDQLYRLAGRRRLPPQPPTTPQEDPVQFITADGKTIYISNGVKETRGIHNLDELADLERAGFAQRPVKQVSAATLKQLLKDSR